MNELVIAPPDAFSPTNPATVVEYSVLPLYPRYDRTWKIFLSPLSRFTTLLFVMLPWF